jgi:hypothetical protein
MPRLLKPMPQSRELADVQLRGIRARQRVHEALRIGPDVTLHAEVPRPSLPRLSHLGIARLRRILRRARRRDQRRIDNRPCRHQQVAVGQQVAHGSNHLRGELVRFQGMPEPEHRRLVGDRIFAQFDARNAPHRLAVIQHVLRLRIG